MKSYKLSDMQKGWFVGDFKPTAYSTDASEVAVKHYLKGDKEAAHFHKIATEITLVVEGHIKMLNQEWYKGDIIVVNPGEITDFEAITNSITVVVKTPGILGDKFLI